MSFNISIILFTGGVGILSMVLEKVLSKGGNETGAYVTGIVSLLVGLSIILKCLKWIINEILVTFIQF